jgi:hypothetical protein
LWDLSVVGFVGCLKGEVRTSDSQQATNRKQMNKQIFY